MFKFSINKEISLKILEKRMAGDLFRLVNSNREHLRNWLAWVDATKSEKDTESFINSSLNGFVSGNGFSCAIYYQNRIAGVIGYNHINQDHRNATIGYWLGESFLGKGIMLKACRVIVDHGFEEIKLHRLEIRCAATNIKSQAIPNKLGFKKEGCFRQCEKLHYGWVDHIGFSLLASEWGKIKDQRE